MTASGGFQREPKRPVLGREQTGGFFLQSGTAAPGAAASSIGQKWVETGHDRFWRKKTAWLPLSEPRRRAPADQLTPFVLIRMNG